MVKLWSPAVGRNQLGEVYSHDLCIRVSFHLLSEIFGVDPFRLSSETTPSVDKLSISGGEDLLAKFVSTAKGNKVKALISIGGVSDWTCTSCFD